MYKYKRNIKVSHLITYTKKIKETLALRTLATILF